MVLLKAVGFDSQHVEAIRLIIGLGGYVVLPFNETPEEREGIVDIDKQLRRVGVCAKPLGRWSMPSALEGQPRVLFQRSEGLVP